MPLIKLQKVTYKIVGTETIHEKGVKQRLCLCKEITTSLVVGFLKLCIFVV